MKPPVSVNSYIAAQAARAVPVLNRLREVVWATVPQAEESIKYTVPFYTYCGLLCYLTAKPDRVVLGLCDGASLPDPLNTLTGNQKQIRHIVIAPTDTLPEKEIQFMLMEAARFNEMRQQVKRLKTRKKNTGV